MDVTALTTIIGDVGFPIAAFAAMYYMCNTTLKDVKDSINELSKSLALMMNRLPEQPDTDKDGE